MAPIPDVIMVDTVEMANRLAMLKQRLKNRALRLAVNKLLRHSLTCGKICASCLEKCSLLQEWLTMGDDN